MKTCTNPKCRAQYDESRRDTYCKACRREASARWRAENPAKAKELWEKENERRRHLVKTPEQIEKERAYGKKRTARARERRQKMTPEERAARNARAREYMAGYRVPMAQLPPEKQEHIKRSKARSAKARRAANLEEARRKGREFRARNPEKWRAYHRQWIKAKAISDPEAVHRWGASKRTEEGRRRFAEWMKQWRGKNREKVSTTDAVKRARRAGAPGTYTHEEWLACLDQHGHLCHYCSKPLTATTRTRDHIVPLIRGGSNEISNIVPACRSCNSRKNTKTRDEYLAWLASVGSHVATLP